MSGSESDFERIQAADRRAERRIAWGEVVLLVVIALCSALYWHLVA